ncbi:MAG TPA: hybrid sensor histidine kinase/response regulator [Clostridiaceae bacterium]
MATKGNLLIIDDEIEVSNTLKRVFHKDYVIHITQSPKAALSIMEKYNIGVILCDQRMPEMKGTEFFRKAKELYPDTIRILITGYSELNDAIMSINEGHIFRYITKPWNLGDLKSSVKEGFEKNTLIRENLDVVKGLNCANVILEDKVTERTQELEAKNKQLEIISNDKSKIIGVVAHDLRSPVGGIFTLSKYIYSNVKEVAIKESVKNDVFTESLEFLEIITDSSKYLLDLINDILDVSDIETGKLSLNLESINYIPFLNKAISIERELAKNKNITVISQMKIESSSTLSMDKIKISQVINNFLENAIKYSSPFGKVIIKVEDDGDYITTKVIDGGAGIPESQRDRLFKIFSKTSTTPTGGEKSHGLGLYISKKIIEAHHGIIGLEDNLNSGSIFYFKLRKNLGA